MDDTSVKTLIRPDPNNKKLLAVTYQNVGPILEHNKVVRETNRSGDGGRLVASVPCNVIHMWLVEEWNKGNTHLRPFTQEFNRTVVKRKLQDPNYKYLLV